MARFVYHSVPETMVGDLIYPLNELALVVPAAYELQRGKYRDREAVLDARIGEEGPLFNGTVCGSRRASRPDEPHAHSAQLSSSRDVVRWLFVRVAVEQDGAA